MIGGNKINSLDLAISIESGQHLSTGKIALSTLPSKLLLSVPLPFYKTAALNSFVHRLISHPPLVEDFQKEVITLMHIAFVNSPNFNFDPTIFKIYLATCKDSFFKFSLFV